ncbi:unannotated protein [freshwater metagenome]|uniref:Unannotated protein n=1 Tax=freshwater metagenome TaxID=449393 RepID=A0A6J7IBC6_9ZZZZ
MWRTQDGERRNGNLTELLGRDHRVDQATGGEVFGCLHSLGKLFAVQRLVHTRTEKAQQRTRFGRSDVAE